ncbi:anthranilate phosphoribosyltransferase [Ferrovum sp. PN-J185]|uniref:anthranilate phosphoribosyltransferase n=1 Tax=Ferrovum sp. PN-J185 TaxID=1356306 RepID=UPI000791560C|nr:anthranilate phosphoribosyltransferase [Ferrovum sp. PN-J185]KXW56128.1 anthranilate phosphoribosyltransferase [Ferrovum sp. PN-J185]MCC6067810.1 anthranilate phosphoribosyltransferase [Ferrovum sp. PN-J185]
MVVKQLLQHLMSGNSLDSQQMTEVMEGVFAGHISDIQAAAILALLAKKGESIEEIAAAAQVMRRLSQQVAAPPTVTLVDTCGTGGDGLHTFNISTASSFVVAAAGAAVAKHGGRSVSSSSGSVDVLEAMGIAVSHWDLSRVEYFLEHFRWTFMFAPNHHSAMKRTANVRKELGIRTIFNILGPLTNPANASCQVLGVFSAHLTEVMAQVLKQLGSQRALVVHGREGLDEISISGPTLISELKAGQVSHYEITPEQFGFARAPLDTLLVKNAMESMFFIDEVLNNQPGPARDIVALNAGAAIYVTGFADTLENGIKKALATIASGQAKALRDKIKEAQYG